jgi:hypothetical protein
VRVKAGTPDPDYPDIPLGGWSGMVTQTNLDERTCLVEWNEATLKEIHPIHRFRCERDGLDPESTWLEEGVLEPDVGPTVPIERPTKLVPRPLDRADPEDVAREAFALTSDDPLPEVTLENLARFHHYLSQRLRFPVPALTEEARADLFPGVQPVLVLRLLPVEEADLEDGLRIEVQADGGTGSMPLYGIVIPGDNRQARLIQAYVYWFISEEEEPEAPGTRRGLSVVTLLLFLVWLGGVLGALLETVEGAKLGAQVGGILAGLVGGLLGSRYENMLRASNGLGRGGLAGGVFGLLIVGALGTVAGAMAVGYLGTILGAIAGTLTASGLRQLGINRLGSVRGTILGASVGAFVYALTLDNHLAFWGAIYGAGLGLLVTVLLALAVISYLSFVLGVGPPRG